MPAVNKGAFVLIDLMPRLCSKSGLYDINYKRSTNSFEVYNVKTYTPERKFELAVYRMTGLVDPTLSQANK
jgi:hypothetical protein